LEQQDVLTASALVRPCPPAPPAHLLQLHCPLTRLHCTARPFHRIVTVPTRTVTMQRQPSAEISLRPANMSSRYGRGKPGAAAAAALALAPVQAQTVRASSPKPPAAAAAVPVPLPAAAAAVEPLSEDKFQLKGEPSLPPSGPGWALRLRATGVG
jgi:hypothetical protein